jgi:hypothetical protein
MNLPPCSRLDFFTAEHDLGRVLNLQAGVQRECGMIAR